MPPAKRSRATAKKASKSAKTAAKRASKKTAKSPRKKAAKSSARKVVRKAPLGRPGTKGKADGRGAVEAWLAAVKPEHRKIVETIDRIVVEEVPDVRFAIKWSTPMYGRDGVGWFAAMASFKEHVGVNFFNGIALRPPPPLGSSKVMRGIRIERSEDLDAKQLRDWMRQASSNLGWGKVPVTDAS